MRFFSHAAHHGGHFAKGVGYSAETVGEYVGSLLLAACVGPSLLVVPSFSLKLYEFVEYTMPEIFTASAKKAGSHFKETFIEHEHCEQYRMAAA